MDSKTLRAHLQKKFGIRDESVLVAKWIKVDGRRKATTIEVPSYRVIDWLQMGYELALKEAQTGAEQ